MGLWMDDFDPVKARNEALIKKAMNETSLESIAARLPPEGQAWLTGLNSFNRRVGDNDRSRDAQHRPPVYDPLQITHLTLPTAASNFGLASTVG